jgi:hypothetical protein
MYYDVHIAAQSSEETARAQHLRLSEDVSAFVLVEVEGTDRLYQQLLGQTTASISGGLSSAPQTTSPQRWLELIVHSANLKAYDFKVRNALPMDTLVSATVVWCGKGQIAWCSAGRNAVYLTTSSGTRSLATPETVGARLQADGLLGSTGDKDSPELTKGVAGLGTIPAAFQVRRSGEVTEPLFYRLLICSGAIATSLPISNLEAVYATQCFTTPPAHYFMDLYRGRKGRGGAVLSVRASQESVSGGIHRVELEQPPPRRWTAILGAVLGLLAVVAVLYSLNRKPDSGDPDVVVPAPPTEYLPQKSRPPHERDPALPLWHLGQDAESPLLDQATVNPGTDVQEDSPGNELPSGDPSGEILPAPSTEEPPEAPSAVPRPTAPQERASTPEEEAAREARRAERRQRRAEREEPLEDRERRVRTTDPVPVMEMNFEEEEDREEEQPAAPMELPDPPLEETPEKNVLKND